jgi:hypothetical protein
VADAGPGDAEILGELASRPADVWRQLFAAAELLEAENDPVEWTSGRAPDGTLVFPHPVYSPAVGSVERLLYELGVIVASFDWMAWDRARYEGGEGLATASAATAARAATAIFRGERFAAGTIAAALADGTLGAVLARLRRWFDDERSERRHSLWSAKFDGSHRDSRNRSKVSRSRRLHLAASTATRPALAIALTAALLRSLAPG